MKTNEFVLINNLLSEDNRTAYTVESFNDEHGTSCESVEQVLEYCNATGFENYTVE